MNAGFAMPDETPTWTARFSGAPIVIGENYGGYDGPFGAWRDALQNHFIVGEFDFVGRTSLNTSECASAKERRAQEAKRRKWSVERQAHLSGQTRIGKSAHDAIQVIKRFASISELTLLLDDGGVLKPSLWGAAASGVASALVDGKSVRSMQACNLTIEFVLSFPYWTPTMIQG